MAKPYLILYNVVQCIGWSVILFKMVTNYMKTGSYNGIYTDVQTLLNIFQTAALLEVVHAAIGIVKSNPVLTGFQVMSRLFVTWHVFACPDVHQLIGPVLCLFAWSVTEVVRYSFYAFSLVGAAPYLLLWCRYTFFLILYPMGVTGELLSAYYSLPYVAKTGLLSATLPNRFNMSFNYYYVVMCIMSMYLPIFPELYKHMLRQRKKLLGGPREKKE